MICVPCRRAGTHLQKGNLEKAVKWHKRCRSFQVAKAAPNDIDEHLARGAKSWCDCHHSTAQGMVSNGTGGVFNGAKAETTGKEREGTGTV